MYSTFLFGCYITKLLCDQILNISIVVCVVMVMMKLQFFFILTFLVFHILYIRWELIKKKKKKEKKVEIIQSHPFSKNRFDNGPHIEDFWSTLSLWKKKIRVNGLWLLVMIPIHVQCAICIQSLSVCVSVWPLRVSDRTYSLMYKRLCNDLLVHPGFIYYNLLQ